MSELRWDPTAETWVIIAPGRGERPQDWPKTRAPSAPPPTHDPTCPFCPGNEHQLLGILEERWFPEIEAATPWRLRVVPNRLPILAPGEGLECRAEGPYAAADGTGHHEVIIESPRHDADLTTMAPEETILVLETYRERTAWLMQQPNVQAVVAFRNHGAGGGASLRHPHSQIIAVPVVPPLVRHREEIARRHFEATGRCLLCEVIAYERERMLRVVAENRDFLAVVPFAAGAPFETWVLPKRHRADFRDIAADEIPVLAAVLRDVLTRLKAALDDPSYKYVIDTASRGGSRAAHLHWRLRIRPGLSTPAGFELGSGMAVNSSRPEGDAAVLRGGNRNEGG